MGLMNVLVLFMAILFTANGQGKRRIHANALDSSIARVHLVLVVVVVHIYRV